MKEMVREPGNNLKQGTFGTNISFDIDQKPKPLRRKSRMQKQQQETPEQMLDEFVGCPGCGSKINEDEWLDCLVGFVSGAHEFEIGNPVRARIVQNLRNQAARMNVTNPSDDWELAIVAKLMIEIERIVTAETSRNTSENTSSATFDIQQQNQLIIETENRVRNTMSLEIHDALVEELVPQLEVQIRAQVEQELWAQFENEWKNRNNMS